MPVLAYYLLTERERRRTEPDGLRAEDSHHRLNVLAQSVDQAVRSYVRGQALVCVIMGACVGLALALLGYPVAVLLGVVVGIAEVLPYSSGSGSACWRSRSPATA